MRLTLVHPTDGLLPTTPYSSLAALPPVLEQAGHSVRVLDVNILAFHRLMQNDRLLAWHEQVLERMNWLSGRPNLGEGDSRELWRLQRLMSMPRSVLGEVEDSIATMRDRERFLQPVQFNRAFDVLRAAHRFVLGLSPDSFGDRRPEDEVTRIHESELPDPLIEAYREVYVEEVLRGDPEMIAITMPYDSSVYYSLKLMRLLKERAPDIPIILGGSAIDSSVFPVTKEAKYYEVFDYAIKGEGDVAFPQFLTEYENGGDLSAIPNLCRLEDGEIVANPIQLVADLNAIPSPDFTRVELDSYLLPDPVATFQTSRGCYYGKCTFCSEIFRKNYRMRRADLVVEDMTRIHESTGITRFQFWDSLAPPGTLRQMSRMLVEREANFEWMAEVKFEKPYYKPSYIETLYEGGCRFLIFGFESGSSRVLDLIDKGNDLDGIDVALENMKNSGIRAGVSWFIGFPTETEREADTTFDFVASRRDRVLFSNYTRTYDIGTDTIVYENQERYGIEVYRAEGGQLDYRYLDGSPHYDREERDQAFLVRGDFYIVKNNFELHYSSIDQATALEITGWKRMGPLLRQVDPHSPQVRFQRTDECHVSRYERNVLPDAPGESVTVAYQIMTGHVYPIGEDGADLLLALEQPRTLAELAADTGADAESLLLPIEMAVHRGLIRILCDADAVRFVEGEPAESALAT